MTTLARKLRLADYFALAFGTMVGAGWLVLMDDWLGRSGPIGAILGFAIGGVLLLPVGYVYGQWVQRLPDAAGVLHRLPMGGGGCRQACCVYLSNAGFFRIVSRGGATRFSATPGIGCGTYNISLRAELSGHPLECQFS